MATQLNRYTGMLLSPKIKNITYREGSGLYYYSNGEENKIFFFKEKTPYFDLKGWKICPQICYEFNEYYRLARNRNQSGGPPPILRVYITY